MKIRKNELFMFTSDGCSDYTILTLCKAEEDIVIKKLKKQYLKQNPELENDYFFNHGWFMKWIVKKGLAKQIKYKECYFRAYSSIGFLLHKGESIE